LRQSLNPKPETLLCAIDAFNLAFVDSHYTLCAINSHPAILQNKRLALSEAAPTKPR
jgi:hypothetical protein